MLLRYLLFVLFYHKNSCLDFIFIFTSLWLSYPLKPMEQRINISKAISLFWLFQQPYNMTKVTKKSLRSTLMRISRIWTSITSLETRQQPRYPLKNDWSHPLYHPLYQTFIPTHHLAPKKNNSETKSLTLSKSTNLTPAASQLSTTTFRTSTVDLFCGNR